MCPHSQMLTKETCSHCTGLAPAYERAQRQISHPHGPKYRSEHKQNDGVERTGNEASRLSVGFYWMRSEAIRTVLDE
jgi:hypothetical protein